MASEATRIDFCGGGVAALVQTKAMGGEKRRETKSSCGLGFWGVCCMLKILLLVMAFEFVGFGLVGCFCFMLL